MSSDGRGELASPLRPGARSLIRVRLESLLLGVQYEVWLSRIELTVAALIAAIGVGVLGAFLVIERRRELAILRTIGADTRHILAGPVIEGSVASIGSVVIGVPIGIGLAVVAIRVLDLFFALPPPLVVVPWIDLVALAALVIAASALALGIALLAIKRRELASVLREP